MISNTVKLYSDLQICEFIQHGQEKGFNILYDQYSDLLYGLIMNSVTLHQYAENIIELAFINIWNFIYQLEYQKINITCDIIKILISSIKDFLSSIGILYTLYLDRLVFKFEIAS